MSGIDRRADDAKQRQKGKEFRSNELGAILLKWEITYPGLSLRLLLAATPSLCLGAVPTQPAQCRHRRRVGANHP